MHLEQVLAPVAVPKVLSIAFKEAATRKPTNELSTALVVVYFAPGKAFAAAINAVLSEEPLEDPSQKFTTWVKAAPNAPRRVNRTFCRPPGFELAED